MKLESTIANNDPEYKFFGIMGITQTAEKPFQNELVDINILQTNADICSITYPRQIKNNNQKQKTFS